MDIALPLPNLLQLVAAFNAALLGLTALARSLARPSRALRYCAGILLLISGAMTVISLDHAGFKSRTIDLGTLESALTLLAGPLTLGLVLALHDRRLALLPLFGPVVLYAFVIGMTVGLDHSLFAVTSVVFIQIAYTLAGWIAHGRYADPERKYSRVAFGALLAISMIHGAQLVRMAGPDIVAMTHLVPMVMGAMLVGLTASIAWSGGPALLAGVGRRPASANDTYQAAMDRLRACIETDRIHLDRGLRLSDAARQVGVPANTLSAAVNACTGESFSRMLRRERIAHAKRLLESPAEARTSIEAIALMSGFHSRSAFYRAFRDDVGASPASFRDRHRAK